MGTYWRPDGDARGLYQHLLKLPELTDLSIEVFPEEVHPKATIEILSKLKKLKKLTLIFATRSKGRCVASREDLAPLTTLPELEHLSPVGDKAIAWKVEPGALAVLVDCPKL